MSVCCRSGAGIMVCDSEADCNALVGRGNIVPCGGCATMSVLQTAPRENALWLGASYIVASDFRDRILKGSPAGERMLAHYSAHSDAFSSILARHSKILLMAVETMAAVTPFAYAMLRLESLPKGDPARRKLVAIRLTETKFGLVVKLAEALRAATKDEFLSKAIDDFREEFARYSGATPAEALKILRRKE